MGFVLGSMPDFRGHFPFEVLKSQKAHFCAFISKEYVLHLPITLLRALNRSLNFTRPQASGAYMQLFRSPVNNSPYSPDIWKPYPAAASVGMAHFIP